VLERHQSRTGRPARDRIGEAGAAEIEALCRYMHFQFFSRQSFIFIYPAHGLSMYSDAALNRSAPCEIHRAGEVLGGCNSYVGEMRA